MKKLLLAVLLTVVAVNAEAESFTIVFNSNPKDSEWLIKSVSDRRNVNLFIGEGSRQYVSKISSFNCLFSKSGPLQIGYYEDQQTGGLLLITLADDFQVKATKLLLKVRYVKPALNSARIEVRANNAVQFDGELNMTSSFESYPVELSLDDGAVMKTFEIDTEPENLQAQYFAIESVTVEYGDADTTAVTEIETGEDNPVEYYNLQGLPVDNPTGGMYIRRRGQSVTKVVIR